MKKVLLAFAIVGFGVFVSPALAADVGGPALGYTPGGPAPWSWTGTYIGLNGGGGFGTDTLSAAGTVTTASNMSGGIVGGQIGANYQIGATVLGIEADGQWSNQAATTNSTVLGYINWMETDSIPWFGTFRGRLGYDFASGWMIYGTGGAGWVDAKVTATASGFRTSLPFSWEASHVAWVLGAGVEWAPMAHLSIKVEYLYLDTGSFGTTANFFNVVTVPFNVRIQDSIVRTGLNYRF